MNQSHVLNKYVEAVGNIQKQFDSVEDFHDAFRRASIESIDTYDHSALFPY
jgi:hypothetical protein